MDKDMWRAKIRVADPTQVRLNEDEDKEEVVWFENQTAGIKTVPNL